MCVCLYMYFCVFNSVEWCGGLFVALHWSGQQTCKWSSTGTQENTTQTHHIYKVLSPNLCVCVCVQARNKQNGELAAIKVIKMEPGENLIWMFVLFIWVYQEITELILIFAFTLATCYILALKLCTTFSFSFYNISANMLRQRQGLWLERTLIDRPVDFLPISVISVSSLCVHSPTFIWWKSPNLF